MQIDWFTLVAQVINFLVLMWLLKRYLYKPILKAIDERESKIVARLNDAEASKKEAQKAREDFNRKNEKFDRERDELMKKAVEEVKQQEKELKEKARQEANTLKNKLDQAIRADHASRTQEISHKIQQEVMGVARKALTDLSSADLEEHVLEAFIRKIGDLKKDQRGNLISTLSSGKEPILVQSAFDLKKAQKTEIENAITEVTGKETSFQYKTDPELISGIELSANGYKLAWSIAEYIDSLEKVLNSQLNDKIPSTPEKS